MSFRLSSCLLLALGWVSGVCTIDLSNRNLPSLKVQAAINSAVISQCGNDPLISLQLQGNEIDFLPSGIFDDHTRLEGLYLDKNKLSTLPSGIFDKNTGLKYLRLDDNQISYLPSGIFDANTHLQYLNLAKNKLSTLPGGIFVKNTGLEDLQLRSNELSLLPYGIFDKSENLKFLDIDDNMLTGLPVGFLKNSPQLRSLHMGTPPRCKLSRNNPACVEGITLTTASDTNTYFWVVKKTECPIDVVLKDTVCSNVMRIGSKYQSAEACGIDVAAKCEHPDLFTFRPSNGACHCSLDGCKTQADSDGINIYSCKARGECNGVCGVDTVCQDDKCVSTCCYPAPSCNNPALTSCVGAFDPFCVNAWDKQCRDQAIKACDNKCDL